MHIAGEGEADGKNFSMQLCGWDPNLHGKDAFHNSQELKEKFL